MQPLRNAIVLSLSLHALALGALPAFAPLGGALYYTFNDGKTRLAFNMENILDKKYFPTVDGNNNISPGAPRNARLTLTTAF